MNSLLLAIALGQVVEFNTPSGYADVVGSSAQQVLFYERWREHACPDWEEQNPEFWRKEYLRLRQDAPRYGRTMFSNNPITRRQVMRTAIVYGYTLKFKVIIHPFGSFWIYYNSFIHAAITIIILIAIIYFLRRWLSSRFNNRCGKTQNPA